MAVGDIFRVQVNMEAGSVPTMNVLHVREQVSSTPPALPTDAVVEMAAQAYTALAAQLSEDWRVISIRAHIVTPFTPIPPSVTVFGGAEAIEGAITGDMVPSNAPAVISLYTTQIGRSGRGRIFLPGIPELHQADGQMTEAAFTALAAIVKAQFEGLKGPFLGDTWEGRWNVFSSAIGPQAASNVERAVLRPNLANMRSRRAQEGFAT